MLPRESGYQRSQGVQVAACPFSDDSRSVSERKPLFPSFRHDWNSLLVNTQSLAGPPKDHPPSTLTSGRAHTKRKHQNASTILVTASDWSESRGILFLRPLYSGRRRSQNAADAPNEKAPERPGRSLASPSGDDSAILHSGGRNILLCTLGELVVTAPQRPGPWPPNPKPDRFLLRGLAPCPTHTEVNATAYSPAPWPARGAHSSLHPAP